MYPIKNWVSLKKGYVFRQRTWYSRYHLGLDLICKKGTCVFAPFNGKVTIMTGIQGGKTVWFHWKNKIMRVMHLSKFGKKGIVKEGDIIGYTGNSGMFTRGPHAHIDISRNKVNIFNINNFIDPDRFNWFNKKKYMFIQSSLLSVLPKTLPFHSFFLSPNLTMQITNIKPQFQFFWHNSKIVCCCLLL